MKSIIVTFDAEGNSVIETRGFVGTACLAATVELERALGKQTKNVTTREMMNVAKETQNAKQ